MSRNISRRELLRVLGTSGVAAGLASAGSFISAADTSRLRVATFCCDVTPPLGQPIYSSYKPLATIEDPLLAKGIVLEDADRRYVLCAVDWCRLCNSTHELFRRKVADGARTDISRVAVQTVHQHTAPIADGDAYKLLDQVGNPPPHLDLKFLDEVTDHLAAAVKKSLDELKPFDSIGTGQAKVERVASSRRIPIGNGKVRTRYSSCTDPELRAEPEGYIDPMLKTITLARGEQPLVRLHYYATHPQSFYGDPRACSDVPGFARERLEKKESVFQIYFTGCAGDIAMGKYNDRSRKARTELTDRLYAGMEASVASTRFQPAGGLQWRTFPLLMRPKTDGNCDLSKNRATLANPEAKPHKRIYAAWKVAFAQRSERPIEVNSLQLGRVRILHLPGEPMVEFQLFAQRLMPECFVAVAGYGDNCCGYLCTEQAFPEGGYEPGASNVVPESEAVLKATIRQLLGSERVIVKIA